MSDYDAVLAVLEDRLLRIEVFANAGNAFDLVIAAAVAYARATVDLAAAIDADRLAFLESDADFEDGDPHIDKCDAQEAAWLALRDAVVATLGPSEQEATDA